MGTLRGIEALLKGVNGNSLLMGCHWDVKVDRGGRRWLFTKKETLTLY